MCNNLPQIPSANEAAKITRLTEPTNFYTLKLFSFYKTICTVPEDTITAKEKWSSGQTIKK